MASNEILAHSMCLKYLYSLPLYRQESYFNMLNVNLSRQTLSNWMLGAANELKVVYDLMKDKLLESNYIQADETTIKVIDGKGKESKSKKYMWMYKTGGNNNSIILYEYQTTRSSAWPKSFLGDYSGYLQIDVYAGYNSVSNAKRFYCLAHIRRKYYDIVSILDKEALKNSRAIIGFNLCEKIYSLEKELRKNHGEKADFFEIRYKERLKYLAPILDEFEKYVATEIEDGSLEVDNNAAERAIKTFVIGRKNWLFANTGKGAQASATIYSIIETAKSYGLSVEKYLVYLMNGLSNETTSIEDIMPWSKSLPEDLKAQSK